MSNQWFRMYHEFATDPKVQIMSEALQRRYVMLLCLNCADQYHGATDDEVAFALRVTVDCWLETKSALISRRLLNEDGSIYGWDNRQQISDLKDPTAAARQKRWRDKRRDNRDSNVTRNVTQRYVTGLEEKRVEENRIDITDTTYQSSAGEPADLPCEKIKKPSDPNRKALLVEVGEQWNELAVVHGLPAIREIDRTRERAVVARAKDLIETYEHETPTDGFAELFGKVRASPFLRGEAKARNGSAPFRASFDWVLKAENFRKIMEDSYVR